MKGIVNRLGNIFKGRTMKRFVRNEQGLEITEIAVIAALILIVCLGSIELIGGQVSNVFEQIAEALANIGAN
jgi:Flp pilus assembly pilin Flp